MRFAFRKPKRQQRCAISVGDGVISVASVVPGADKARVTVCEVHPFPENTDAAWAGLAKAADLGKKSSILVMQPGEYQLVLVEAPAVPEAEIKSAVRWKLKDMVSFPVESATLDVLHIPSASESAQRAKQLYAVVARNENIKRYMESCEQAGIGLEVIDIAETAQRNIATRFEEDGRALAMLSLSHGSGLLTFTAGGELYHSRQIEVTLSQMQIDDEERQSHIFDRVALELQRSLDNFERQFPHLPVSRLMLAPFPAREAFREFITSYLGLRVETFSLSDIFDLQDVSGLDDLARQAQVMSALGAALRVEPVA